MNGDSEFVTEEDMHKDLNGWGIGLLLMGVLHFVLSDFLSPGWGVVLIIGGILTLAIKSRSMFIVIGIMLIVVGLMNFMGPTGWKIYGGLQIFWGIMEFVKYGKYGSIYDY